MISFCSTCMGRRQHLEQTLAHNIRVAAESKVRCEFVLLDYSSPDGLAEFIARELSGSLRDGALSYYRLEGAETFHMAHAKNITHRLAAGPHVCNLDADNLLLPFFAEHLNELLSTPRSVAAFPRTDESYGGCSGRIALHR
jgi:hypothetical protein